MLRLLPAFVVAVALMALLPAGAARADGDPVLTLTAPAQGALGEAMTLTATSHDASGAPLAGETLRFLLPTELLNKFGRVEIGRAVTAANGVATLSYEPRQTGAIVLEVVHDTTETAGQVRVALEVAITGDRQLFTEQIGTDAPKFELWALVAVLSVVWFTLLTVAVRLHAIARAGSEEAPVDQVPDHFRQRKEWS